TAGLGGGAAGVRRGVRSPVLGCAPGRRRHVIATAGLGGELSLRGRVHADLDLRGLRSGVWPDLVPRRQAPMNACRAGLLVMIVAVLSACSIDLSQKNGCRDTSDCLGGSVCVSGRCVDPDAGTVGDSSVNLDGAAPPKLPQIVLWLDAANGFTVTGTPP